MNYNITIDVDKRCAECGKGGATDSGICLACAIKVMSNRPLKSEQAKAVRARLLASKPISPFAIAENVTKK